MHDHAGDRTQAPRVGDELVVDMEEAAIDEVVAFDAGEGEGIVVLGEAAHPVGVGQKRKRLALPGAPGPRGLELNFGVVVGQSPVIGRDHVAPLALGNHAGVIGEGLGENPATAFLVEPFELGAAQGEDASEHKLGHALRVGLGVSERERRTPRAAEHLPAFDPEMLAQPLDIVNEMPRRVLVERGMRRRTSAATLIVEDDAISARVMVAAHYRIDAAARTAMEKKRGLSRWRPAFLEIELMQVGDFQPSGAVRDELGIEREPLVPGQWSIVHRMASVVSFCSALAAAEAAAAATRAWARS